MECTGGDGKNENLFEIRGKREMGSIDLKWGGLVVLHQFLLTFFIMYVLQLKAVSI